jgi:CheY-like chemotaxis protein
VLLLDADASFRQVAEEQLKECSYSVTTCGTPAEAVSLLLQRHAGESTNGGQAATAVTAAGANAPAAAGAPSASEAPASQGSPFDVFIVEARLLLPDSGMSNSRKLVKLCRTLPFILMSSSPHPDEVWRECTLSSNWSVFSTMLVLDNEPVPLARVCCVSGSIGCIMVQRWLTRFRNVCR